MQEFQVVERLPFRRRQGRIEHGLGHGDAQGF
jgi:hypothetical protein